MNDYEFYVAFSRATALDKPEAAWTNRKQFVYYCTRVFCFGCIFFCVVFGALDVIFRDDFDLNEVSSNFIEVSIYVNSLIRVVYRVVKQEEISAIIDKMNGFKRTADNKFERLDMAASAKLVKQVQIAWVVYATGCIAAIDSPYIYQRIRHGRRHLVTAIYTYYDQSVSPYYELTLVYEVVSQLIHAYVFINLDMFFFSTVVLLNKQFEILASDFRHLMYVPREEEDGERSLRSRLSLQRTLSAYVRHHQDLLDVVAKLEACLSLPSFLQCLFSTAYIMFGLFLIVTSDDNSERVNAIGYLYGCSFQIGFMCLFGQMLSNKVEILDRALY